MEKPKSALASPNISGQTPHAQSVKSVSIASTDDTIPSSNSVYKDLESDGEGFNLDRPFTKPHRRPSIGRRIRGRPSVEKLQKARTPAELLKLRSNSSGSNQILNQRESQYGSHSSSGIQHFGSYGFPTMEPTGDSPLAGDEPLERSRSSHRHPRLSYHDLIRWIQKEKARRAAAKARKKAESEQSAEVPASASSAQSPTPTSTPSYFTSKSPAVLREAQATSDNPISNEEGPAAEELGEESSKRRDSDAESTGSHALDMLHEILEQQLAFQERPASLKSNRSSKVSLYKKLRRQSSIIAASSDTDYGEPSVPTCEVTLDNSKTLSYAQGAADNDSRPNMKRSVSSREREAWKIFKYEIVRLAHTLKLKGWRRVSLERSDSIGVERLSGALTNAVYVVTPPRRFTDEDPSVEVPRRHRPRKLLLRIYGSQVEHLIDRESELQILRRLARKRIGPRLLGTFTNGRFEEFLNAVTLTAENMRERSFSRQIAKRMRELHDGIELLESEVAAGPFVWQNIDKWTGRAEKIVQALETANKKMMHEKGESYDSPADEYLIGCDFGLFKLALGKYRKWLEDTYDGLEGIKERLVFAHNDAQYGNILRLVPESESPLLLPTNEHKRLVVIDFEYANANVPGLEFANHFTEWCYDYHDPKSPHACRVSRYPTPNQQVNFLTAYVTHRPNFNPAPGTLSHRLSMSPTQTPTSSYPSTPAMLPMSASTAPESIASARTSLVLPAPAQAPNGFGPVPLGDDDQSVKFEVERLRREVRAWRGVNSAQWVLWGVVQAKIPPHLLPKEFDTKTSKTSDSEKLAKDAPAVALEEDQLEDEDGFDYLGYARDRAAFFWGDILYLGIMNEKELPEHVVKAARILEY